MKTQANSQLSHDIFDVIVIGAGVVGCAVARRFTLAGAHVGVLEKASDILDGASKANSAILHTGFDAPADSLELSCITDGYHEYQKIHRDLGLPLEKSGAYVVAWKADEAAMLEDIVTKAHANGISNASLISTKKLNAAEPNLSTQAHGAISIRDEAIIDPWSAPYAYLKQAIANGGECFTNCEVISGNYSQNIWQLETSRGTLQSRLVINCAGLYGDKINHALTGQSEFNITPRKGQFVVFDKAAAVLVKALILPVPTARTKGIVLFRTVFGNLAVGPTAQDQQDRRDTSTDEESLRTLVQSAIDKIPVLRHMPVSAAYAGLRPACEFKDYQISRDDEKNYICVGAIRSTGLSGALGIANYVFGLAENLCSQLKPIKNPVLPESAVLVQNDGDGLKRDWQREAPGEIICHCESVTRREIEQALRGPLAAKSLGGLKRQTRVTMGRCQGFYCSARLGALTKNRFANSLALEHEDE